MIFEEKSMKKATYEEKAGLKLVDNEVFKPKFIGEVHDSIRFLHDGKYEIMPSLIVDAKAGEVYNLPVGYNLVVDDCSRLIAALMKNQSGYSGIKYWEVGSGLSSWDDANPPAPVATDVGLKTPLFRKAIKPTDISFIDSNSNITNSVTNRIQITVTFESDEANGYLREFGLFGGGSDCTSDLGSGIMINRKTHGVIYKTPGIELTRTIRFTF